MSTAPTLQSLVQDAIRHAPLLARQVLDGTQHVLDSQPRHHLIREAWMRQRLRFESNFEQALLGMLRIAVTGHDPLQRQAPTDFESLSLVDEQQALQDVALADVISTVEQSSRPELHQIGNFFAALRGTARARKSDNLLRPDIYANALHRALAEVALDPEGRYALMRIAAQPLAAELQRFYAGLCAQLREAELSRLVSSHAATPSELDTRRRTVALPGEEAAPIAQPQAATLDGLARRIDARNSRPGGLDAGAVPLLPDHDLLSRLYREILADPRLLPPVKALLARLQVAVVRLAMLDLSLLRRQDHPAWQLLNRVSSHGAAFDNAEDPQLKSFIHFMEAQADALASQPSAEHFVQVLATANEYIGAQARQRGGPSAKALAALEREKMRGEWLNLVREQVRHQLAEAMQSSFLSPLLISFMQGPWAEIIVQAMVLQGRDSTEAQDRVSFVDDLLDSLQPRSSEAERAALRAALPGLVARLQAGCDTIKLAEGRAQRLLDELMLQHGKVLRGHSLPPRPSALTAGTRELSPDEQLQQLLSERASQMPSRWAHTEVDRGELPTVPVALYAQPDTPQARQAFAKWLSELRLGHWYHMFVQSRWLTAQLAWVGESGQYYLFIGQDADDRPSLTRGALSQLLANGLITELDEDGGVVQRAVDQLMLDLDEPN